MYSFILQVSAFISLPHGNIPTSDQGRTLSVGTHNLLYFYLSALHTVRQCVSKEERLLLSHGFGGSSPLSVGLGLWGQHCIMGEDVVAEAGHLMTAGKQRGSERGDKGSYISLRRVSVDIIVFHLSPPPNGSTTSQQCLRLGIQTFNIGGFGVHARFKLWLSPSLHSAQVLAHNFWGVSSHTMCSTKS